MASRRHALARLLGQLASCDCYYIGKLNGVGKVWQVTACDAASSCGLAMVFVVNPHSAVTARLLRHVSRHFRKRGHGVLEVLGERGSEPEGAFDEAFRVLDI